MTTNTEALTYDHIVALALEYGFKLKPQVDGRMALNDYVIDFARAVYDIGRAAAKAADVGGPDARKMFNAGWCAAARFCGREDVVYDGLVGHGGCPAFEYAYRAAIDAAKGEPS